MEQLELFTTFNGHFVYDDDIYALGKSDYLKEKYEHDAEQNWSDAHASCFDCGLSWSDTVDYQERGV
jgi:hypothetical protein